MTAPDDAPIHPTLPSGLRLGAPFGITLRLHWSFLLLGAWLMLGVLERTGSFAAVVSLALIAGMVFGSVALHEYGHALVARHFGIGTREITLLPFGGVAQLVRSPDDPRQDLWISLAGPAVNFALAGLVFAAIQLPGVDSTPATGLADGSLASMALRINLLMGAFNLVPALPMDGGRVLRAALSMRMSPLRATRIATVLAQVLAGAMMAYGLVQSRFVLAMIGGFVWITARAELRRVELVDALRERAEALARMEVAPDAAPARDDPAGEWTPGDGRGPRPGARTVGSGSTRRS